MSDVRLIHLSSKITLCSRGIILLVILLFEFNGGYLPAEKNQLILAVMPMSCYFIVGYLRFALKYPYPAPDEKRQINSKLIVIPLLVGYCIMITSLVLAGLNRSILSFQGLNWMIVVCESLFAIYATLSLPRLFKRFSL